MPLWGYTGKEHLLHSSVNEDIVFLQDVIVAWLRDNKGNFIQTVTGGLCICIYVFNCIFQLRPGFNKSATLQKNVWYRFLILITLAHFSDAVKLLGVTLDQTLSFDQHVSNVVRSCMYHTRALRHTRPLITIDAAKMIAFSIVGARLDYCNSLLFGTTACNLDRLQRIRNTLVRAVLQKPFSAHSTELQRQLHWLPIRQRIEYKIVAITYKAKHSGLPVYLHDLLHEYQPTRTLRSSTAHILQRPPLISLFADRSFSIAAPTVWNSLSPSARSADAIGTFKSRLKTDLFALAYITLDGSALSQRFRFACD